MRLAIALALAGLISSAAAPAGASSQPTNCWIATATGLPERGQWRNGFDLADFDGDGRLDLVHGPPRGTLGPPVIFRGRPEGDFERWSAASFPELPYDYGDAAAADFDGDGHADLALGLHLRGLVVLAGDGRGGFETQASFLRVESGPAVFSSRALTRADLDADSRPDVIAIGEGPTLRGGRGRQGYGLRVFSAGEGRDWFSRELQPISGNLFGDEVAVGDFDGDGRPDLAASSNVQGQRGVLFWGAGDGGFLSAELEVARPRSYIDSVAVADFDGDGRDELVLAFSDLQGADEKNGLDLMIATADRRFTRWTLPWDESSGRPTALGTGDPDGDGDPDLVTATASGALVLLLNRNGSLTPGPGIAAEEAGRGCRGYHVQLADLDDDGADEVLVGFAGEDCPSRGRLAAWRLLPTD